MKSTIILYQGVPITPNKNFAVDSISLYLSGLASSRKLTFTNQNYVRQNLYVGTRVLFEQESLDLNASNWNYCSITNIDENGVAQKTCYYFIKKISQSSKEVALLDLEMDTLNTIGVNITLTPRTRIHRQHKNRFYAIGSTGYGVIDKTSEGISPVLYKQSEEVIKDKREYMNEKWYIVYQTKSDPKPTEFNQINPVVVYCFPQYKTRFLDGLKQVVGMNAPLLMYKHFMLSSFNGCTIVTIPQFSKIYKIYDREPEITDGEDAQRVYYYVTLSYVTTTQISWKYNRRVLKKDGTLSSVTLTLETGNLRNTDANNQIYFSTWAPMYMSDSEELSPLKEANYNPVTTSTRDVESIDIVDKTDPRIIKIVESPYCPFDVDVESTSEDGLRIKSTKYALINAYNKGSGGFLGECIQLMDSGITKNEVYSDIDKFEKIDNLIIDISQHSKNEYKNSDYEIKLLSSEFYSKKFVYDSFHYEFKFEELDVTKIASMPSKFEMGFSSSLAVTSKYMFDFFNFWKTTKETSDYNNICLVARNNEIPIYNNQYINYLRTGLRYDLKNAEAQDSANIGKIILTTAGTIGAVALGVASGNAGVVAGSVLSGVTAITSSVAGAIQQNIATTRALEQKQAQLQAQQTSVQSSDDLPLLNEYTKGNFAKICTYAPSLQMFNSLYDLFFYTGYACEEMGTPSLDTRLRFNFIQADIDIDETASAFLNRNFNNEIIENYKSKWAEGITNIHAYNGTWDFKQEFENWESSFNSYLQ